MFQLNLKISATISLREKTLQLQFYTTKSAVDIKVIGNNEKREEKFQEFGFKNGAFYFVREIMPKFINLLYSFHGSRELCPGSKEMSRKSKKKSKLFKKRHSEDKS